MEDSGSVLAPLDGRSPALFLVGGLLLVVFAGVNVAQALTDPNAYENLHAFFGPAGFAVGFVGLLGLYPALADRSPKLARVGAVCVTIGLVGFTVIAVGSLASLVGIIPGDPPAWVDAMALLALVGMVPGFFSFGAASLLTDVYPRLLGYLLLAPALVFAVMLVGPLVAPDAQAAGAAVISSAQALAILAIGYVLRGGGAATDRAESPADATA